MVGHSGKKQVGQIWPTSGILLTPAVVDREQDKPLQCRCTQKNLKNKNKMLCQPQEGASNSAWEDLGGFQGVKLEPSGEGEEGSCGEREQLVHTQEVE